MWSIGKRDFCLKLLKLDFRLVLRLVLRVRDEDQRLGLDTSIYFPQDVSAPQETPPVYPTIDVSTAYTPQIGSQGGSIFAGQFSQVETETGEARFTINENFTTINPAANVVEVGPSPFKAGASSHLTLVEASSPFNPIVSSSPPGLQGNTSNA
ncbi:hypothetical protein BT69DRAFT_1341362 [Atractiella rhizophila]|nr:hypothetical protein BT69DRAFT_1341362 [Atractiella rhizophila]